MSTITIKSKKPMVLIPIDEYESMKETMEIIDINPGIARELKKEHAKIEKGEYISLDDFKKKHAKR